MSYSARDARGLQRSLLQDVNKLAAKKILSLGCLYAFPLTWSLLSCTTACCGNVFPSAHLPAFFTLDSLLPEKSVSALMLL